MLGLGGGDRRGRGAHVGVVELGDGVDVCRDRRVLEPGGEAQHVLLGAQPRKRVALAGRIRPAADLLDGGRQPHRGLALLGEERARDLQVLAGQDLQRGGIGGDRLVLEVERRVEDVDVGNLGLRLLGRGLQRLLAGDRALALVLAAAAARGQQRSSAAEPGECHQPPAIDVQHNPPNSVVVRYYALPRPAGHHQRVDSSSSSSSTGFVYRPEERYFQPSSATMKTTLPSSSSPAIRCATRAIAPDETPAKTPSSSSSLRVQTMASWLVTKIFRSSRLRSMIGGMKPSSRERSPWTGSPCMGSAATIFTRSPSSSLKRRACPMSVPPVPRPATNASTSPSSSSRISGAGPWECAPGLASLPYW